MDTTEPHRPSSISTPVPQSVPVLQFHDAALGFGARSLWTGLDLDVGPGEFVAVLGANGSGKTSLLRCVLGLQALTSGSLRIAGGAPRRGSPHIGYVPQQRRVDPTTALRARDLVRFGLDGHRWGFARPRSVDWGRVEEALAEVDALHLAQTPVGVLSGGEQQRVRIAQALVSDPVLLLCDEPLLSLDLRSQQVVTELVDRRRREHGTAVVFVTHEINPVLPYVDRVFYLAGGQFRSGRVDEVLTSATLSALYGAPVEVIRAQDRIFVAGLPETPGHPDHPHETAHGPRSGHR